MEDLLQLKKIEAQVLKKLLEDKTTGKNIIWATDSYENLGPGYERNQQIRLDHLQQKDIIRPRIQKDLEVQKDRTKKNAEVHTPAWIVNQMNNQVDLDWLKNDSSFNREIETSWIQSEQKVAFKSHTEKWKTYVKRKVLEITCGEAPFLTSRYDCSNGQKIEVKDRIGLLDRKLRIITENTRDHDIWLNNALSALKSVYGYEIQGDSLLVGRLNLYLSFIETVQQVWKIELPLKYKIEIADIISWNIIQMDGLTYKTPNSISSSSEDQLTLFNYGDFKENSNNLKSFQAKINLWGTTGKILFSKVKGSEEMKKKFNVVIGNPPYQEDDGGNGSSSKPVYNKFLDEIIKLNPEHIELIIPSRWFNGGKGLDNFRKNLLSDHRLSRIIDFPNAKECFPGTSIGGGVCIVGWDKNPKVLDNKCSIVNVINGNKSEMRRSLTEFPNFVRNNEAVEILRKVRLHNEPSLTKIMSTRNPFGISTNIRGHNSKENNDLKLYSSKGEGYISQNEIPGLSKNENIGKYKVMISRVTSEHAGEPDKNGKYKIIAKMNLIGPNEVCTDSYIIGYPTNDLSKAKNFFDYLKTKFVRFLILQNLSSINLSKESYQLVPLQDFSKKWDDESLFNKYGLTSKEIEYINNTIKEY